MAIATGTRFERYEILALLGKGGMGEVYLAQDPRLRRKVALKLLPVNFTQDADRLRRFEQEAYAASALNHPNIITIYEIGESGETHFIATEFIEGQTLRQQMTSTRMKLPAALDDAVQIASALAAAHAAGIVHRDIKPENIMLRPDGLVKVLDSGLAKLTESEALPHDTDALTAAGNNTQTGVVMGTVRYMSPEQARGLKVDARSDIFSLGVVLYELVTGRMPFEGATAGEVMAAILEREPPPIARYTSEAPTELQRIISKALRKDREERYQGIKDLQLDLKGLKEELEFQAKQDRAYQPEVISSQAGARSNGPDAAETAPPAPAGQTGEAGTTLTTSSAEYVVSGIKRHKLAALLALLFVVLAVVGLSLYWQAKNTGVAIDSIAVLPFVNQNRDPETEYRSDGLTESIINSLTQLPALRVSPRSSVFHYKGKETDPMVAGSELSVRAVLTGRIMQREDNLSISVELVDVRENKQLWGNHYEGKVSDLLAVQREMAKEISSKLRLKLSGAEQNRVTKRDTDDPEAYKLYWQGHFWWNKFTPEGLKKSIDFYNQAIAIDPRYALAYAALAASYSVQANTGVLLPREVYPKAKWAAEKALEFDAALAETHFSLGVVNLYYEWDWAGAEREITRGIELNPNLADGHALYGHYLKAMGRVQEATAATKRAQALEPFSPLMNNEVGYSFYYARQYDEAIAQGKRTLEIDPNFLFTHILLGRAYEQKGMFEQAITAFQRGRSTSGGYLVTVGSLGHAYAVAGQRGDAQKLLDELKEMEPQRYVSPYAIALIYTGLGEKQQALTQLEKAYEARDSWLIWLKVEPLFDSLRSEPRFADLLRRMGL